MTFINLTKPATGSAVYQDPATSPAGPRTTTPLERPDPIEILSLSMLGVALIRPSAVLAAKLRRAAEVAEVLLIITTIPLALGALDVYTDLLETFR
mgnify:CR=1 FL=1